jgi:hypothetical protein
MPHRVSRGSESKAATVATRSPASASADASIQPRVGPPLRMESSVPAPSATSPAAERPRQHPPSYVLGDDISHPRPHDQLRHDPSGDADGDAHHRQPCGDLARLLRVQQLRERLTHVVPAFLVRDQCELRLTNCRIQLYFLV